ncbi:MAG: acyloxyacyl hydrolase [Prevotellaceae bacterium]|jgi:hypothetical protein|nr:acyloxyacyl hydrolase [Prevotellaceae bacterium]
MRYFSAAFTLSMLHATAAFSLDSVRYTRQLYVAVASRQGNLLQAPRSEIAQNYYVGMDVRIGWQTDSHSRSIYDALYRYPRYGAGYYMGNMNGIIMNSDAQTGFGKPAALYAFFGSPIHRSKRWAVGYTISAGLSYNFNAYDPNEAPYNVLVGSKRNAYIDLAIDVSFLLPRRSTLGASLSFQHFSNGSYQKPNKGLNLLSGTLAYQRNTYRNRDKTYAPMAIPARKNTLEWYLFAAGGVRMLDTGFDRQKPREGKRWHCYTLSTAAMLQTSFRRKLGVGADLFYFSWGEHVVRYRAREEGKENISTSAADNMALGLYLAHEVGYKRAWLITDVGFYPLGRVGDSPVKPRIYERAGVKYYFGDRLFLGVAIKAHGAKADYVEWLVGYSLIKS